MSEWAERVEILWGFTEFYFKQVLKVSAFYLEKQKSFIPKKNKIRPLFLNRSREFQQMAFAVLIFSEGFGPYYL